MKRSEWEEYLKGFYIVDCAIREKDIAYILAVQEEKTEKGEELWHLISWAPKVLKNNRYIARSEFFNLRSIPKIAVEFKPEERYILCDSGTFCWVGKKGKSDQPGLMQQMKTLWGEVYLLNSFSLSKRNGFSENWENVDIHPSIMADYKENVKSRNFLLTDFDGFSENQFYLMDWHGYVFYQEEDSWHKVDLKELGFPELQTNGICCGPDGWVYIFGRDVDGGKIFQGRGDQWKVIWTTSSEIFHVDMAAYQDYVIMTNNLMRLKIKNGEVTKFEAPIYGNFISAKDNLLMLSGADEAAIYDGEEWKIIISPRFDENGVYLNVSLKLDDDALSLLSQLEYASSADGENDIDSFKKQYDLLSEDEKKGFLKVIGGAFKKSDK
jgi:hypothetical protein